MQIKPIPSIHILAGLVLTASLAACANPDGGPDHAQHHVGQSENTTSPGASGASSAQGGMMGGGMTGSQAGCGMMGGGTTGSQAGCGTMGASQAAGQAGMQHMNKDTMCAMYRSMQTAPTEQDRQAMMERNMQGMSPEMRQQHMAMMRQQCQ
jgi:hypothetical protein